MYQKEVRIGKYEYTYYYHNVKIKGKVKNICLGRDKTEAEQKLKKIREESRKTNKPVARIVKKFWKPAIEAEKGGN